MTLYNEQPLIFSHKNVFLSYVEYNKWPMTFGYPSQQKYFFNIQWHKEKTFKHQNNNNTIKINAIL